MNRFIYEMSKLMQQGSIQDKPYHPFTSLNKAQRLSFSTSSPLPSPKFPKGAHCSLFFLLKGRGCPLLPLDVTFPSMCQHPRSRQYNNVRGREGANPRGGMHLLLPSPAFPLGMCLAQVQDSLTTMAACPSFKQCTCMPFWDGPWWRCSHPADTKQNWALCFHHNKCFPSEFLKALCSWLLQTEELFWQPLEAGRMRLSSSQGLQAFWPWEECELWLLSPLSQWVIAKV